MRSRFILGFVDETTSVFDLVQSTGLPLDEAADALADLFQRGIIGFANPA